MPPLKPGDFVRVKPEMGSKEWKAATVVQQHTSPRSYIVDVGGRRIRRNRVVLKTDSPKLHAGYQSCHANIEEAETDPEKPCVVPHAVPPPMPDTRMEKLPLDYQSDQSVTRKSPARKIPPSPEVAATRGLTLYTTRCGRQVKEPVKLVINLQSWTGIENVAITDTVNCLNTFCFCSVTISKFVVVDIIKREKGECYVYR